MGYTFTRGQSIGLGGESPSLQVTVLGISVVSTAYPEEVDSQTVVVRVSGEASHVDVSGEGVKLHERQACTCIKTGASAFRFSNLVQGGTFHFVLEATTTSLWQGAKEGEPFLRITGPERRSFVVSDVDRELMGACCDIEAFPLPA